ncbi:coiled-coil-helix-coiled-coil-helix domain-containing protein 1 [Manacus vitellinus]|nr:coiled-coil-helix-coiled-coil-helix domain-containing protein 1 [Manacus vitellinus]
MISSALVEEQSVFAPSLVRFATEKSFGVHTAAAVTEWFRLTRKLWGSYLIVVEYQDGGGKWRLHREGAGFPCGGRAGPAPQGGRAGAAGRAGHGGARVPRLGHPLGERPVAPEQAAPGHPPAPPAGARRQEATCITEMSVMMACWKQNDFNDAACAEEIRVFYDCVAKAEKQRRNQNEDALSSRGNLPSSKVNKLLRRFPQIRHYT